MSPIDSLHPKFSNPFLMNSMEHEELSSLKHSMIESNFSDSSEEDEEDKNDILFSILNNKKKKSEENKEVKIY